MKEQLKDSLAMLLSLEAALMSGSTDFLSIGEMESIC